MILFSVIVPVYNVEKYLQACLDSILKQSYSDYEIILVEDGSTDRSRLICQQYADKYSQIRLYTKENSGLSDSRNVGIQMAMGNYLLFVDSDDFIGRDTMQMLAEACEKWHMPDVVLSEGMYEVLNSKIAPLFLWKKENFQGIGGRDALLSTMRVAANWSPCGKAYRVDYWKRNNFTFQIGRLAEDMALIDRIVLEAEKVCMVSGFYYYRRFREGSIMSNQRVKLQFDILYHFKNWEGYWQKQQLDDELIRAFKGIYAGLLCHIVLGNAYLCDRNEKKILYDQVKAYLDYLNYSDDKEIKLVDIVRKVIGIPGTCWLLGIVKRIRLHKAMR